MDEGLQDGGPAGADPREDPPAPRDGPEEDASEDAGAPLPDWLAKKLFKIFS